MVKGGTNMKEQIYNPYLPLYEYIPDGEPHLFQNRIYIFGSHDKFGDFHFCRNNYVTWSCKADDLSCWRYEGVIYHKNQDSNNLKGKKDLYAPDVVRGNDGKYYLYYSMNFTGKIGVAVSQNPQGPYKYLGNVSYPNKKEIGSKIKDHFYFDPAVINDDGKIYLLAGFGPSHWFPQIRLELKPDGLYLMELNTDMLTIKNAPIKVLEKKGKTEASFNGHEFFEAASIRKINGLYYLIYSSIQGHELCYAVSSNIEGKYQYGGVIISNGNVGYMGRKRKNATYPLGNNHGSIIKSGEQYYIFYHRHTNYTNTDRQGMAERINIERDGSIKQVEMTSSGINPLPLIGKGIYPSSICCYLRPKHGNVFYPFFKTFWQKRTKTYITQYGQDSDTEETQYIRNIRNGALIGYKWFNLEKTKVINLIANGKGKGIVYLRESENGINLFSSEFQIDTTEKQKIEIIVSDLKSKTAFYLFFEMKGKINLFELELE